MRKRSNRDRSLYIVENPYRYKMPRRLDEDDPVIFVNAPLSSIPAEDEDYITEVEYEFEGIRDIVQQVYGEKGYQPDIHDFTIRVLARERVRFLKLQQQRDILENLNSALSVLETGEVTSASIRNNMKELIYINRELSHARTAIHTMEKRMGIDLKDLTPAKKEAPTPLHVIFNEEPPRKK